MMHPIADDELLKDVPLISGYRVLDPGVLLEKLGEGGMGAVYRGKHTRLLKDVAVKVLKGIIGGDPQSVARFRREAIVTAELDHPALVRVLDVQYRYGLHYIVMEFVDGETLETRITRRGPLSPAQTAAVALGVSAGLAAAHARTVIHRDIKPSNIMLTRSGEVKLADLGIAKSSSGTTASTLTTMEGALVGTPQYMAPELFDSPLRASARSDLYALGATMHYMLTGHHPFSGMSVREIIRAVDSQGLPDVRNSRADVPAALAEIIRRATMISPDQRYASVQELTDDLRRFLASTPEGTPSLADETAVPATVPDTQPLLTPTREELNRIRDELERLSLAESATAPTRRVDPRAAGRDAATLTPYPAETLAGETIPPTRVLAHTRPPKALIALSVTLLLAGAAFGTYMLVRPMDPSSGPSNNGPGISTPDNINVDPGKTNGRPSPRTPRLPPFVAEGVERGDWRGVVQALAGVQFTEGDAGAALRTEANEVLLAYAAAMAGEPGWTGGPVSRSLPLVRESLVTLKDTLPVAAELLAHLLALDALEPLWAASPPRHADALALAARLVADSPRTRPLALRTTADVTDRAERAMLDPETDRSVSDRIIDAEPIVLELARAGDATAQSLTRFWSTLRSIAALRSQNSATATAEAIARYSDMLQLSERYRRFTVVSAQTHLATLIQHVGQAADTAVLDAIEASDSAISVLRRLGELGVAGAPDLLRLTESWKSVKAPIAEGRTGDALNTVQAVLQRLTDTDARRAAARLAGPSVIPLADRLRRPGEEGVRALDEVLRLKGVLTALGAAGEPSARTLAELAASVEALADTGNLGPWLSNAATTCARFRATAPAVITRVESLLAQELPKLNVAWAGSRAPSALATLRDALPSLVMLADNSVGSAAELRNFMARRSEIIAAGTQWPRVIAALSQMHAECPRLSGAVTAEADDALRRFMEVDPTLTRVWFADQCPRAARVDRLVDLLLPMAEQGSVVAALLVTESLLMYSPEGGRMVWRGGGPDAQQRLLQVMRRLTALDPLPRDRSAYSEWIARLNVYMGDYEQFLSRQPWEGAHPAIEHYTRAVRLSRSGRSEAAADAIAGHANLFQRHHIESSQNPAARSPDPAVPSSASRERALTIVFQDQGLNSPRLTAMRGLCQLAKEDTAAQGVQSLRTALRAGWIPARFFLRQINTPE
jgi:serine/threonine protein kinase